MKKQRKPRKTKQRKHSAEAVAPETSRRDLLRLLPMGAAGALAAGGIGYFALGAVRAGAAEYDLSRLGNGKPAVVQVHDPQCPTCNALQRQARRALRDFDDEALVYLVADIRTGPGAAFAQEHRVPHVTLLLFDGRGRLQTTLRGMKTADELRVQFGAHLKRFGPAA